jgi:hypothetical protein
VYIHGCRHFLQDQKEGQNELKEIYKALIVITSCLILDIEDIVKDCDRYRRSSIVRLYFLFLFASFLPDNLYRVMAKMSSRVDIDEMKTSVMLLETLHSRLRGFVWITLNMMFRYEHKVEYCSFLRTR